MSSRFVQSNFSVHQKSDDQKSKKSLSERVAQIINNALSLKKLSCRFAEFKDWRNEVRGYGQNPEYLMELEYCGGYTHDLIGEIFQIVAYAG